MYYRFTNKKTPMSDWGHAMMAENEDAVSGYGANKYVFDGKNAVPISDLEQDIKNAWEECLENNDFGNDISCDDENFFLSLSSDEAYDAFNPSDIVMSAEGYDCELVVWLWNNILEPRGIFAITTEDGAVVFDENLLVHQPPEIELSLSQRISQAKTQSMVKMEQPKLQKFDLSL